MNKTLVVSGNSIHTPMLRSQIEKIQELATPEFFLSRDIHLYQGWYTDDSTERQQEYLHCLNQNINNIYIDRIILVCDDGSDPPVSHPKITFMRSNHRMSYSSWFTVSYEISGPDNICILSNTDIYFDDTLSLLHKIRFHNIVLCLSRWEILEDGGIEMYDRIDSQDTWIWQGKLSLDASFPLGYAGCDNKIAYIINSSGKHAINPCESIRSYHHHLTKKRNYINDGVVTRVPGPYAFLKPYDISQIIVHPISLIHVRPKNISKEFEEEFLKDFQLYLPIEESEDSNSELIRACIRMNPSIVLFQGCSAELESEVGMLGILFPNIRFLVCGPDATNLRQLKEENRVL